MKATELRIGNLVLIGKEVNILELVDFADIYENNTIIHFEPIPLTEEWLLKMGFVYRGIYYHFPKNDIFKLEQYKLKNAYFLKHSKESLDSVRINYVHQLQNLYFALTGEELTFSTPKTS
jgi:hypothetical protein